MLIFITGGPIVPGFQALVFFLHLQANLFLIKEVNSDINWHKIKGMQAHYLKQD